MSAAKSESGLQLFARLGKRPSLENIEPAVFPDGIGAKDVIEVYGDDGVGKTQLLLHLVAKCILPKSIGEVEIDGLECSVVYIDTDFQFSVIRLVAIIESRISELRSKNNKLKGITLERIIETCLDRLFIVKCNSSSELVLSLFSLESLLASKTNISVLMLDSISAFYWIDRGVGESQNLQEANQHHAASAIEKLVSSFKIAVIVTKLALFRKKGKIDNNHERSPFLGGADRGSESDNPSDEHSEYLSTKWQKIVTHRIIMQKTATSQKTNCKSNLIFKTVTGQHKKCIDFLIEKKGLAFLPLNDVTSNKNSNALEEV